MHFPPPPPLSLYYECVGGARPSAGIFEWDTTTKQVIELFANASGSMTALPFEEFVVAVNKANNRASVFVPQGMCSICVQVCTHVCRLMNTPTQSPRPW